MPGRAGPGRRAVRVREPRTMQETYRSRSIGALALLLFLSLGAPGARADVKAGRAALQRGDWKAAEAGFKSAPSTEAAAAALGLAETYLATGRFAEALAAAKRAAAAPAEKAEALRLEGEA